MKLRAILCAVLLASVSSRVMAANFNANTCNDTHNNWVLTFDNTSNRVELWKDQAQKEGVRIGSYQVCNKVTFAKFEDLNITINSTNGDGTRVVGSTVGDIHCHTTRIADSAPWINASETAPPVVEPTPAPAPLAR
jgi:hypothetical protein